MAKRKREPDQNGHAKLSKHPRKAAALKADSSTVAIQIITGAYEKTLHGVVALIPRKASNDENEAAEFSDNFLFDAHSSVVRCLALSSVSKFAHSDSPSVILASGGLDEKINLFRLSATSPTTSSIQTLDEALPKGSAFQQKPANREIGSLLHHSSGITKLVFPNRKKLVSGAGDNVIAISRTQDWTVLSTIKAPIPIPSGRPSGDTISLGDSPAGFNDFAIHPSLKLMISVGKGEKCMRLWNLITGKKAGVLNFESALLRQVGESKHSSGEGRKVVWNPEGDAFVIGFERGAVLFGMDSIPKALLLPVPSSKLHQICYFSAKPAKTGILAISTEDGRILFYSPSQIEMSSDEDRKPSLPSYAPFAQLGGSAAGVLGRIKDFECLTIRTDDHNVVEQILVTCGSDGIVSIWRISPGEMASIKPADQLNEPTPNRNGATHNGHAEHDAKGPKPKIRQIGKLLGTYQTNERITCLKAFVMQADNQSGLDEDKNEVDFDAHYANDTPKSDSEEDGAVSEASIGEGGS